MTTIKSPIPSQPVKAAARRAHWTCFLAAAAALQLTACGGDDAAQTPSAAVVSGAMRNLVVMHKQATDTAICDSQVNDTAEKLLECMTLPAVREHQTKFAEIAKANNGTRMTGTSGYDASVAYARKVFEDAGYKVTVQPVEIPVFSGVESLLTEIGPASPTPIVHKVLDYSGSGDIAAPVSLLRGMAGCTAADFAGFPKGSIALVRRGVCDLTQKMVNAAAAGAVGVVIYNPAGEELEGAMSSGASREIPAAMVGKTIGEKMLQRLYQGGLLLHFRVEHQRTMRTTYNVLAESGGGDPAHVTMVGAHLDSVAGSGGSNDNASGVAAVLETARQMARVTPVNKLRFALWGANEEGLLGSRYYTKNLDAAQKASIGMYLNFDMIGSPNYVFYVYGGDGSAGPKAVSNIQASTQMVDVFADFYAKRRIPYKRLNNESKSDHQPFAEIGIPFAGIFTGAEEIKSQEEVAIWGGKSAVAYDPCAHKACDDLSNYSEYALDINADAVAYSILYFAMNKVAR